MKYYPEVCLSVERIIDYLDHEILVRESIVSKDDVRAILSIS